MGSDRSHEHGGTLEIGRIAHRYPFAAGFSSESCANLVAVETILSIVQVAISVILIFLVLMHSGKDSGLSGAFGVGSGAGPLGGGSMVERNLNRWTIAFAVLFFVNAIVLLKSF